VTLGQGHWWSKDQSRFC